MSDGCDTPPVTDSKELRIMGVIRRVDTLEDRIAALEKPVMDSWSPPGDFWGWFCGASFTMGAMLLFGVGGALIAASLALYTLTDPYERAGRRWPEMSRDDL